MCLSLPGRVVALDGFVAEIDSLGQRRRASILAQPDVRAGDWVLFEAGLVLRIVSREEAADITATLEEFEAALAADDIAEQTDSPFPIPAATEAQPRTPQRVLP